MSNLVRERKLDENTTNLITISFLYSFEETDDEENELLTMDEKEKENNEEEEKYFMHSDDEHFSKMENGEIDKNVKKKKLLKEIDGKDNDKICDIKSWSIYELLT